jgi:hypothetical protein
MTHISLGCLGHLVNIDCLNKKIDKKIPGPLQNKILNFFKSLKKTTGRPKFPADLPLHEALKLFLYWLIKYESEEDLGIEDFDIYCCQ